MAPNPVSALLATFMTEAWRQDQDAEDGYLQCYKCTGPERAGNLVPANNHSRFRALRLSILRLQCPPFLDDYAREVLAKLLATGAPLGINERAVRTFK